MRKKKFTAKAAEELKKQGDEALDANGYRVRPERSSLREVETWQAAAASYSEWADSRSTDEDNSRIPVEADGDKLAEEDGAFFQHAPAPLYSEGQMDTASQLLGVLQNILSPLQYQVYELHIERDLSFAKIAERLSTPEHPMSRSAVQQHWERAQFKIRSEFSRLRGA